MIQRLVFDITAMIGRPDSARAARRQAVLRTHAVSIGFALMLGSVGLRGAWLCMSPHEAVVVSSAGSTSSPTSRLTSLVSPFATPPRSSSAAQL